MYRSVLALLFAAVLLLGGCAAGKQTVPKEKSGQKTNMNRAAFDRSDEKITYVVDRSGNIVGEPIVGAITEKKQAETLQKLIEQVLAADMG